MKKILIGVGALAVVVVFAGVLLLGNIDKIVKGAIEGVGSELLGVPLTVTGVEIKARAGSGQITGLTIANPSRFSVEPAFKMDMIRLGINIGSLGKQPLVIDELNIQKPVVQLEVKGDGSSNLQTLMDNMKQNSSQADKKASEQQPDSDSVAEGEPARMTFKKLSITAVTVNVHVLDEPVETVVLPDIILADVGQPNGLTPGEVGQMILGEIISKSLDSALQKSVTEKLEETTKGFFDDLKKKMSP